MLRGIDFGTDGVLRTHPSTVATDTGSRPVLASGSTVLVMVDNMPNRAYILCADPVTDTLNIALAGPVGS